MVIKLISARYHAGYMAGISLTSAGPKIPLLGFHVGTSWGLWFPVPTREVLALNCVNSNSLGSCCAAGYSRAWRDSCPCGEVSTLYHHHHGRGPRRVGPFPTFAPFTPRQHCPAGEKVCGRMCRPENLRRARGLPWSARTLGGIGHRLGIGCTRSLVPRLWPLALFLRNISHSEPSS